MLFFLTVYYIMVLTKIWNKTTIFNIDNIRNVSCAANQNIRMISEGSCDTEDWSNDAENSAAHHRNKLHFDIIQIEIHYFKL